MKSLYRIAPRMMLIYDTPAAERTKREKQLLERHFADLCAVFLHKLTEFMLRPGVSKREAERLREFFGELLKAREFLGK